MVAKLHFQPELAGGCNLRCCKRTAAASRAVLGLSVFGGTLTASCRPRLQVIKYPLTTESAMKKIEDNNTLVFIVDPR